MSDLSNFFRVLFGRKPRPRPGPPIPPVVVPSPPPIPPPVGPDRPAELAHAAFDLQNAARARRGLPPYTWDDRLARAAVAHAAVVARAGFGMRDPHSGLGDGTPWQRIRATGYVYSAASENIALGQTSPAEVIADLITDPPHAANIFGPYTACGVGVATLADGRIAWVFDLATPQ